MGAQTFAVIGAGVAGLQVAAQLKQAGYTVTLFEKSDDVGGVWRSNYAGFRLQVRKWHYEVPGFPWVDSVSPADPRYPSGAEVQAYLQRYAAAAGLLPLTRFGVEVRALRPAAAAKGITPPGTNPGAEGWDVEWADREGKVHSEAFDFVVVATGLFNEPSHPEWAQGHVAAKPTGSGPWVVDAKNFTDESVAQGKRVVVIGAGKTAHDVGVAASKVAAQTTLVARRGHWQAPRKVLGFLPFEFATYTRWSWALQPAYYTAGPLKKGAHALFRPITAAAWGLFGAIFNAQAGTPAAIKPKHGLLEGAYDVIGIVDTSVLSAAFKSGRLAAKAGSVRALNPTGVALEDGSALEADIVVLATGYRATARQLLPADLQAAAGYKGDSQWLYRNVLPTGLNRIAFIGQNATFQHVLTTALQSKWLVDALTGDLQVPPRSEQEKDVAAQEAWIAEFGGLKRRNNFVWAQHGKYHDALLEDIRGSTAAYPFNPVAELFGYIKNQRYASLFPGNKALLDGKAGTGKGAGAGIPVAAVAPTA